MSKQNSTTGLYEHPQDRTVAPPKAVAGTGIVGNGLQAATGFVGWIPPTGDGLPHVPNVAVQQTNRGDIPQ